MLIKKEPAEPEHCEMMLNGNPISLTPQLVCSKLYRFNIMHKHHYDKVLQNNKTPPQRGLTKPIDNLGSRPLALPEYESTAFPVYLNRVTWTEVARQNLLG